ncbi:MAG: TIGR04282 family arsenosugar biosynthesis glycosyltransferase [Kiloniellales bacterium]
MSSTNACHLVIFTRAPRFGTVKKRLARDIGALAAWQFHRGTTARLLRRVARDPRWRTWLAVTPDNAARAGSGLWPGPYHVMAQGPGDLGQRMGRVLQALPRGPVVIVGSDIPGIERQHVAQAFRALGRHDWVIGPAADGGYWLIGAKRRPGLRLPFAGVAWGGPEVRAQTLSNLSGHSVAHLEELIDIDHGADLERWRRECPS